MGMKEYTHAKGFNVTSLKGIAGLYFFQNSKGEILYIGMCNGDFKNRINSHAYGSHGKLSLEIHYIRVVIADPSIYPLHVLEHLFIWYFKPRKNYSLWFFRGEKNEWKVKRIAKKHNLYIRDSLEKFILSFESVLIEKEWDDNLKYKRYGNAEGLFSKKVDCSGTLDCLCFQCTVYRSRYI
ncbi:hypothetical protein CN931_18015 [Bacillus sp. AFS054943]|nr:hypothetical protein CN931_18015 [Bacillus sp. AFS054943]TNP01364.1 hypothetical protein FHY65_21855 [Bacillus cereus]CEY25010.1 Uncharacterised protein [Streptococcus pneumoniae]CJA95283.1 Uncharacterised protein [Streptococcus pneumoniae]CJB70408.1 Uncharacterised protein [Streptococcus pneumoniae]